jgi:hypothetical protein
MLELGHHQSAINVNEGLSSEEPTKTKSKARTVKGMILIFFVPSCTRSWDWIHQMVNSQPWARTGWHHMTIDQRLHQHSPYRLWPVWHKNVLVTVSIKDTKCWMKFRPVCHFLSLQNQSDSTLKALHCLLLFQTWISKTIISTHWPYPPEDWIYTPEVLLLTKRTDQEERVCKVPIRNKP